MKPTAKQLAYLRALAIRTGQTFTRPASRSEASREIQRKQLNPYEEAKAVHAMLTLRGPPGRCVADTTPWLAGLGAG
jgi:hypothetical protein